MCLIVIEVSHLKISYTGFIYCLLQNIHVDIGDFSLFLKMLQMSLGHVIN